MQKKNMIQTEITIKINKILKFECEHSKNNNETE